jgi:hypothetical protein
LPLTGMPWNVFFKYKKTHTKRKEVVYVMYAFKYIGNVSNKPILFIQGDATPNPFGKLRKCEKIDLGVRISKVLNGTPITDIIVNPEENDETEEETARNDLLGGFDDEVNQL